MVTGFNVFCVYIFIKNLQFSDNKYNIMNFSEPPMKEKLLVTWNEKRRKKDGIQFKKIEQKFNSVKPIARLFSSYYIKNPNFYIQDLFDDEFLTYKTNMNELKMLKEVFTIDLKDVILYVHQEKIKTRDLFVSNNSIPKIFKMGLSFNSLVIMNDLFNIMDLNKDLQINTLERARWNQLSINLRWYKPVIQKYLDTQNWKKITQTILNN